MHNAGRFFGYSYPYYQAYGGDARAFIMKGEMTDISQPDGGGAAIFETRANSSAPGNHGIFCNPLYLATNGCVAFGNLTDAADQNDNAIKPTAWVQIAGDGSWWSSTGGTGNWISQRGGSASQLPPLAIMSQSLVSSPVPGAIEYDGTNLFFTDDSAHRWTVSTNSANVGAGSQSVAGEFANTGISGTSSGTFTSISLNGTVTGTGEFGPCWRRNDSAQTFNSESFCISAISATASITWLVLTNSTVADTPKVYKTFNELAGTTSSSPYYPMGSTNFAQAITIPANCLWCLAASNSTSSTVTLYASWNFH